MKITTNIVFALFVLLIVSACAPCMELNVKRPAPVDISSYKKIAVGDVIDEGGGVSPLTFDLSDALSNRLVNTEGYFEVINRVKIQDLFRRKGLLSKAEYLTNAISSNLHKAIGPSALIYGKILRGRFSESFTDSDQYYDSDHKYHYFTRSCLGIYYLKVIFTVVDTKSGRVLASETYSADFSDNTSIRIDLPNKSAEPRKPHPLNIPSSADKKTAERMKREWNNKMNEYRNKKRRWSNAERARKKELKRIDNVRPPEVDAKALYRTCCDKICNDFVETISPYWEPCRVCFEDDDKLPRLETAVNYLQKDMWERGLKMLEQDAESNFNDPEVQAKAHYNFGMGLLYSGNYEAAIAQFNKALDNSRGNDTYIDAVNKARYEKSEAETLKQQLNK